MLMDLGKHCFISLFRIETIKANGHFGVILVAALGKTPSSSCEQEQDKKLIASMWIKLKASY